MTTALFALGFAAALAQDRFPTVTVAPGTDAIYAEGLARFDLKLSIQPGLHAYQNPPSQDYMIPLAIEGGEGTVVEKIKYPRGIMATVGGETEKAAVYEGDFVVPVYVRLGKAAGKQTIKLKINVQQCTDSNCFPPESKTMEFSVQAETALDSLVSRKAHELAVVAKRRPL